MTRRVSPQPPLEEKHQDQEQADGNQMRLPLALPEDQLMHQSSWKERESPSRQQSEAVEVANMPAVFGDPACPRCRDRLITADQSEDGKDVDRTEAEIETQRGDEETRHGRDDHHTDPDPAEDTVDIGSLAAKQEPRAEDQGEQCRDDVDLDGDRGL